MRYILYILFLGLAISSCKEEDNNIQAFEIEVLGKGLDCGDLFVVKILNNQEEFDREVETKGFDQAYVLNLEEEYKISGLKMRVELQKSDESVVCTFLGPTYPLVRIIEVIELLNCKELETTVCECYTDYDPVCGCNGKTYSNACQAECHGIMYYQEGECQ